MKEYKARLILFPRRRGAHKKDDSSKEDIEGVKEKNTRSISSVLPIINKDLQNAISEVSKGDLPEGEQAAYVRLRKARSDARYVGAREKRAAAKVEAADAKK